MFGLVFYVYPKNWIQIKWSIFYSYEGPSQSPEIVEKIPTVYRSTDKPLTLTLSALWMTVISVVYGKTAYPGTKPLDRAGLGVTILSALYDPFRSFLLVWGFTHYTG